MIAVACVMLVIAITFVVTQIVIPGNAYKAAETLLANGQYEEALVAFEALGNFKDAEQQADVLRERKLAAEKKAKEERLAALKKAEEERLEAEYAVAEELVNNGETAKAAIAFAKLENYSDARERSFALWDEVAVRKTVAAGWDHTVGLQTNGTVIAAGRNEDGQCDVLLWKDIIAVSADYNSTIGLKPDGSVVWTGQVPLGHKSSEWCDIVAMSSDDFHCVGLKADGTVVFEGANDCGMGSVTDWSDIVAISSGDFHTVGLKTDGTVVATQYSGNYYANQCNVSDWTDIVAIGASAEHTVGLKADGTVVAVGSKSYAHKLAEWNDIVAISTAENHTVGLKADGTVVAAGDNNKGECDVSGWRNIVSVEAGNGRTIGVKADGTVVVTGVYGGVSEVSGWKDIKLPE